MTKKLSEISNIYIGQSIRDRIVNMPDGDLYIIQIKDADKTEGINQHTLYKMRFKGNSPPRYIKKDDLLFVSRFFRNSQPYSVLVNLDQPNVIAAPNFYIISVNQEVARPEYLHWYLNSEAHGGKFFKAHALGSSALNVSKANLGELPVRLPPLEEQDRFIKLIYAAKKERELMNSIAQKRQNYLNEIITAYAK